MPRVLHVWRSWESALLMCPNITATYPCWEVRSCPGCQQRFTRGAEKGSPLRFSQGVTQEQAIDMMLVDDPKDTEIVH